MEKRYSELIDGLDLLDIYLNSASFRRHAFPDPESYPEVKASFSAGKATYSSCDDELCVYQDISFLVEEMAEDRKKTRKVFTLKGVFTLVYSNKVKMDEEIFELFKKRNIPVNMHPYARELIQNFMTRAGLPPFTLPALKIRR
jgi:preprotein translocase subunit SecB